MASRRRLAFAEEIDLASRTGPRRRDSDWGGNPRTHEEDLAWAARRAGVSIAAATMHARDGGTGAHSDDVVHLCDAIADELGLHGHDRAVLLAAAQLHDIGKVTVPAEILNKPGPLDDREWASIRQHTVAGEEIVQSVPELAEVARLVRHSHERWDGRGYPDGLAGEQIPLASRIIFCADAFHAIRADRPYRRGCDARAALEEVRRNAGSQFDTEVVGALVKSAGGFRTSARNGGRCATRTFRSRRLLTLLLTLAIGGSALAAGGASLLRGDDPPSPKRAAPAAGVAPAGRSEDGTAERQSGAAAPGPSKRARHRVTAATRRSGGEKGGSTGSDPGRGTSPAGSGGGTPPAVPKRRRVGRAHAPGQVGGPGRSGEAPRRPAVPGKPVGGAPGRSEEAPGKPSVTPSPPATKPSPKADTEGSGAATPPVRGR